MVSNLSSANSVVRTKTTKRTAECNCRGHSAYCALRTSRLECEVCGRLYQTLGRLRNHVLQLHMGHMEGSQHLKWVDRQIEKRAENASKTKRSTAASQRHRQCQLYVNVAWARHRAKNCHSLCRRKMLAAYPMARATEAGGKHGWQKEALRLSSLVVEDDGAPSDEGASAGLSAAEAERQYVDFIMAEIHRETWMLDWLRRHNFSYFESLSDDMDGDGGEEPSEVGDGGDVEETGEEGGEEGDEGGGEVEMRSSPPPYN